MIGRGFGNHLTGWSNGDFNYDGKIDGSDYALIDNAFNQLAATGARPVAQVASRQTAAAAVVSAATPFAQSGNILDKSDKIVWADEVLQAAS